MRMKFLLTVVCLFAFALCSFAQTKIWNGNILLYDYDHVSYVQNKEKKKNTDFLTFVNERNKKSLVFLKSSFSPYIHYRQTSNDVEFSLITMEALPGATVSKTWGPSLFSQAKNHVVFSIRRNDFAKILYIECVLKDRGDSDKGNKLVVGDKSYSPVQKRHFVSTKKGESFSIYSYETDISLLQEIVSVDTIKIAQATLRKTTEGRTRFKQFYELYLLLADSVVSESDDNGTSSSK